MSRTLDVITPEHVAIRYELAGFGSRAIAAAVDSALQLCFILFLVGVLWLLAVLNVLPEWHDWDHYQEWQQNIIAAIGILLVFLIYWGYFIAFETWWNGQTPGKRWMQLRVIKDGGYPIDFRAALLRNLLRVVDSQPGLPIFSCYGLAFITVLANPHYKRLGDLAAGTLVVYHGREEKDPLARVGFGAAVTFRLLDHSVLTQLARLSREEYRTIARFLDRRAQLPPALRGKFAERLAQPLIEKFAYQGPALGMDYERWLEELDLAYRNRALGTTTAAPTAPAPVSVVQQAIELAAEVPTTPTAPTDGRKW